MNKKQEIILRHTRAGESIRKISRELKISRVTIRRYLEEYNQARSKLSTEDSVDEALIETIVQKPCYNVENRGKRKLNDDVIREIDRLIEINEQKCSRGLHKQAMKKIDILESLQEKGFNVGYTTVCNYVSEKIQKRKEAFIRQVYSPGDTCEFDWGEVKLIIDGQARTLNMAVFTSANNNYRYARLFYRQDSTSFQQAHVYFFDHIGGVYYTLVYDNMRVVISKFIGPSEKEPTEALLKLSIYYQFAFRFCNIRRGNEKGHVERSVEYVRRKAFCKKDDFASLEEANLWLQKILNRLNTRFSSANGGARAIDLLAEEKKYLLPVPPRFDCGQMEQCKVDKYSVITYLTNRYSVPDHLVGKMVDVKVYPEKLVCYHDNHQLCQHQRQYGKSEWTICLDHYLYTLKVKPGALAGSQALVSAPEDVKSIFRKYFSHAPKDFVELLVFLRDYDFPFNKVNSAIEKLNQICPHDISVDKIKVLCMQKNGQEALPDNPEDKILQQSLRQLHELSMLMN
jgi:transposase